MRLGAQISWFTWRGGPPQLSSTLEQIARNAEAAGFYSIWVMDHFYQIPMVGPSENDMLEGYSALSFLAGVTKKVKLGTMVTGVTYRHPGVLVKTATTLDVLSGGRSYLGIGAAWFEREHVGLGVPFPALSERFERLEEALQIAKQMWSGKNEPYHGKHYHLAETLCVPQPLQKPHPPILIGGGGEKKTLRLVAKYADACNLFAMGPLDDIRHKLKVLQEHCEREGRPYDQIEKTVLAIIQFSRTGEKDRMSPQQAVDYLGQLAELGVQHTLLGSREWHDPSVFELLASDVIPHLSKLTVRATSH